MLCTGAREAAFRNIKSIAECLADELINAHKVIFLVSSLSNTFLYFRYFQSAVGAYFVNLTDVFLCCCRVHQTLMLSRRRTNWSVWLNLIVKKQCSKCYFGSFQGINARKLKNTLLLYLCSGLMRILMSLWQFIRITRGEGEKCIDRWQKCAIAKTHGDSYFSFRKQL